MPTPSLLIVPARFKTGKMYSQIPTSGDGDFNVTRATTATRFGPNGLIESVASGIPRLDYFASGGVVGCPALLVEPSAANGILNSTDTTTSWTLGGNLTSSAIDVIGVTGNELTVAVSGSSIGASAGRLARGSMNFALASGSTYTISFLLKKTGTHTIGGYYALIGGAAGGNLAGGFNVSGSFSSGSVFNTAGTTNRIRRVEQWGTDVYRCSETFTMTASGSLSNLFFAPLDGVTSNTSAVNTKLGFAAPQIELGSVPTSFIPTTTAAITRNADVISVSGAVSGSIGQTEGTIYVECVISNYADAAASFITISDNTINNRVEIRKGSTNSSIILERASSTPGGSISITATSQANGVFKMAVAYKSGDTAFFINGIQVGTTNTATFTMNALTHIYLGSNANGSARFLNDRIRAAALYTTRLTDTELAALTAP